MYSGPGSGSMMAAVSAWLAVASQLDSAARGYNAVIAGLRGQAWSGAASTAMIDASQPLIEWITTAAAKAEETAAQARAAGAAYVSAYAATVPPALVTANRARYVALVASNIVGRLRLYCGHTLERSAHRSHKTVRSAFGGPVKCAECGCEPATSIDARAIGLAAEPTHPEPAPAVRKPPGRPAQPCSP